MSSAGQSAKPAQSARPALPPRQAAGEAGPSRHRSWVLAATILAMFMVAVEGTIVATAMPTIVAELGGFHLFSWVFAIFLLTQAVTIPVYGKLADTIGRKPVFYAGACLFLLGSALAGFSQSMHQLIAFRALQGLGGGAVQPIAITIIGDIYTPEERARIQGYLSSVWGISAVIGPALGAFFVETLHWQWVFWINLPIGAAAIALLAAFLKESVQHRQHRIDYLGSALLMAGTSALMLALIQGGTLGGPALAALLALAAACLAGFFVQERRAEEPTMQLKLWRQRIIATGNLGALVTGALMIGVASTLPTYVQGVMGRGAAVAGFVLAAMSIGWPIGSTAGGRLMVRTSYRYTGLLGAAGLLAGSALLAALHPPLGPLWAAAGTALIGLGMGFCTTTYLVAIQTSVGWSQRGVATSSNMFMRMVGSAMGAALFGSVLNAGLRHAAASSDAINRMMEPALRGGVPPAELAALTQSMAAALHNVYLMGGALAVLTLGLNLAIPRGHKPGTGGAAAEA